MENLDLEFRFKFVCVFPDLGEFTFYSSDIDSAMDVLTFHSDCLSVRVFDRFSGDLISSVDGFVSIEDLQAHTG